MRRRRMFRLIGLYVVGAWVAIQVAEALFQAWGIPETAMRFVFIAAVLCFPIALVFGWIYDITGKGIVRTESASPGEMADLGLKRTDYLILTAFLVVGAAVLISSADKVMDEIEQPSIAAVVERLENSIAVLPFANLDINTDTGFFSDGITEEILHRLSALGALHVLASNSSFAFRDSSASPAELSEKLGVRYLLQGSVRREQENVRITARLLDETGVMVWSNTFDRELKGVFTIQSEIASKVSSEVLNEIVPLADLPAGRTTENMEAYDQYLVGRAYLNARPAGWQGAAEEAFRAALALDEGFAPAWAGLATSVYVALGDKSLDEEALEFAMRAIELDPDLARGHAILGLILSEQTDDLQLAAQHLRRAIDLDSSLAIAYNWLAIVYNNQGLGAEWQSVQRRGLEIDPLNPPLTVNVSNHESRKGNFERAEQMMLRLTHLPEPPGVVLFELMSLNFDWGRFDKSNLWAQEVVRHYAGTTNTIGFAALAWSFERLGMSDDADYWINVFLEQTPGGPGRFLFPSYLMRLRGDLEGQLQLLEEFEQTPGFDIAKMPPFVQLIYGASHLFANDHDKGLELLEGYFDISIGAIVDAIDSLDAINILHEVAFSYKRTGQTEKSQALIQDLSTYIDSDEIRSIRMPNILENVARNQVARGDFDAALETMREAVELGWSNYAWISNGNTWKETLERPDFRKLMDEVKVNLERQRENVEADGGHIKLRAEVELILSQ